MDLREENGELSEKEGETFEDAQDESSRRSSREYASGSATPRDAPTSAPMFSEDYSLPKMPGGLTEDGGEETSMDGSTDHNYATGKKLKAKGMEDSSLGAANSTTSSPTNIVDSAPSLPPRLPPRDSSNASQIGLSGVHSPVHFPPPPRPPLGKSASSTTTSQSTSRKYASPFAWLSRNTSSQEKKVPSPPLQPVQQRAPRRGTNGSIATIGSNSELMLGRIDDGSEADSSGPGRPGRNSLRDRFKFLRMKEEAGITSMDMEQDQSGQPSGGVLAGLIGRSTSISLGVGNPYSMADDAEGGLAVAASTHRGAPTPASPLKSPTVNMNLAPGTAAGIAAGPAADSATEVDWDLWQSVVYEGPAAVARSSPEELHQAIAGGIPSAIRGVVWQVLAQSKNEDLEGVYRDLVARGTEKERRPFNISMPNFSNGTANDSLREKESMISSASSVHSDVSTPAAGATNGQVGTPPQTQSQSGESVDAMEKSQAASNAERNKKAKDDAALLQKLEKAIRRDLGARTSYSKYVMSSGLQEGLFGVCKAYALFDEAVGYAQGMNFIAMPLLFNMPEEEAFCLLVRLMNHYHLREMFIADMPGLHLHLYQFERLLEDFEPALYCHLHRRGVTPSLYATQWFLTLFAYRFPLQLVLRVYDLILSEGLEGAILRFGLALMQKNVQTLLAMKDMSALTNFLKERLFDVYIDKAPSANSLLESGFFGSAGGVDKDVYRADMLVQDACAVKITPEMLKAYTMEWEEKQAMQKAHEAELESLRSANASLSLRVRTLEERAEKSDVEHVGLASELVRTKVENDSLRDENESLRGQVDNLRAVVDTQGREVEEKLRSEMERVRARNEEVMEENRGLEVQLEEMEKSLVEAKMGYAEISGEHETLKQKWKEMTAMLNSHSLD